MKKLFQRKTNFFQKAAQALHLRKENPRDKYLKLTLRALLFIAVFLAGYLTARLQGLFS